MAKSLPDRNEVSPLNTWDLTELYNDKEAWEKDIARINELSVKIAGSEGRLASSSALLLDTMQSMEEMLIRISCVSNYAMCLSDEDTGNTDHQAMAARSENITAEAVAKTSFLDPELLSIPVETFNTFYEERPELSKYKYYINEALRLKDHTLSADKELLLALSAESLSASANTFGLLNNADMTFPSIKDENGEEAALSNGRFVGFLLSPDREVRRNAFTTYYNEYNKLLNTYASLYNGQVKSLIFSARARHYNNTLEAAVIPNDVTPAVYSNLVKAVNENVDALHSYVALRKELLGVDELHMYDIYVPMLKDFTKEVTFEEAKETALKALSPLGEDYTSVVREGFENRWIDVFENKGKRGGAYETAAYGHHPFVLLNFDNKFDDMFTLVHEMGHAMHSYYSDKANPFFESQYKIFVAEVASTCNELLLLYYLLDNSDDPAEKRYLLNHYLDMFKGTLFRQTQFAEFEMLTNEMAEKGESLNKDNLSGLYLDINKKYYGPDIVSDKEIAWEWARIPHFYYNFYVYQYATSFSASVAIVNMIRSEGAPAVQRFRKFLASGCTKPPVELLKDVGVDLETAAPFVSAINAMRGAIAELKKLL